VIIHPFTVVESVHGKFIVNRHCDGQIDFLAKTGRTHIEREITALLTIVRSLPEKCVIVDAGANIGLVSIPLAAEVRAKGGEVHAFEPQRMLYQALCGSAVLNDLPNLMPRQEGLGESSTPMWLPEIDYTVRADFGMAQLKEQCTVPSWLVEMKCLDDLLLRQVDLLKIDVEGMECAVLRGARETLHRYTPWCWVEYHMAGVEQIKACFDGLDYKFYRADELNMLCAPSGRANFAIHADEI
jgi:FkbM family methyltransferase